MCATCARKTRGRGQAALAFVEMMLGDPGRVEAWASAWAICSVIDQAVAFAGRYASSSRRLKKLQRGQGAHASKSVRRGGDKNQCSFCREWRP